MKRTGFLMIVVVLLATVPVEAQTVSKDGKLALLDQLTHKGKENAANPLSSLPGTWWRTASYVSLFNLTPDQQKKMDEVFQESRVRLITLDADLKVQEVMLEPLMAAERLDEAKTLAQIDRVAQARAELEKANARMLLGIRQVMTSEQWTKLQKSSFNLKFRFH
jgi:Spy/CpxP family protein refolding chaperone